MTRKIEVILRKSSLELKAAGIESPYREVSLLLQHLIGCDSGQLLLQREQELSDSLYHQFIELIERRKMLEPIAYIVGHKEFYGREFLLNQSTLIPRPDSETLIDAVLTYYDQTFSGKILDLGTGSGCLIISLLKELPEASGVAVDIAEEALAMAKQNAAIHQVTDRITFVRQSWTEWSEESMYDLIISNPPYIASSEIARLQPDVRLYEPSRALDGGEDGLDSYRQIIDLAWRVLKKNGKIVLECGTDQQSDDIVAYGSSHGLRLISSHKDLAGYIRGLVFEDDETNNNKKERDGV